MILTKAPRRYSAPRLLLYRLITRLFTRVIPGKRLYRRSLREEAFEVRKLHHGRGRADKALRVIQLSDFHAGPFLDFRSLGPLMERVSSLEPHVICLTGDFITDGPEDMELLRPALAGLGAGKLVLAVFGNHDYRHRREDEIARILEETLGGKVLRNDSLSIPWHGRKCFFIGIEDIEEGKYPDIDQALHNVKGEGYRILLSHNPEVIDRLAPGRVDLILSGHTHGGQIQPFFRRGPSKYRSGLYESKGMRLYVNPGIGVLVLPFRFKARPELTLHLIHP